MESSARRRPCRPSELIGETGVVTLRHETWPPRFGTQAVSLKLQQQLKSILSPEPSRAPLHSGTGGRSLMVYVPLPRSARFLTKCGLGASNATASFDRALAFLTHDRSGVDPHCWSQPWDSWREARFGSGWFMLPCRSIRGARPPSRQRGPRYPRRRVRHWRAWPARRSRPRARIKRIGSRPSKPPPRCVRTIALVLRPRG
jgi:hypothetical protein